MERYSYLVISAKKYSYRVPSYVYYTQIMQAETLASAYRLWRRNWRGRGREHTAGALVWQVCDFHKFTSTFTQSWLEISRWMTVADYIVGNSRLFPETKPAYFAIARELRPYTVGIARKTKRPLKTTLLCIPHSIDDPNGKELGPVVCQSLKVFLSLRAMPCIWSQFTSNGEICWFRSQEIVDYCPRCSRPTVIHLDISSQLWVNVDVNLWQSQTCQTRHSGMFSTSAPPVPSPQTICRC